MVSPPRAPAHWPALPCGVDVVVEPEDVVRVVAALDLDEPLVVDLPDFPHHPPVTGGQVIDPLPGQHLAVNGVRERPRLLPAQSSWGRRGIPPPEVSDPLLERLGARLRRPWHTLLTGTDLPYGTGDSVLVPYPRGGAVTRALRRRASAAGECAGRLGLLSRRSPPRPPARRAPPSRRLAARWPSSSMSRPAELGRSSPWPGRTCRA